LPLGINARPLGPDALTPGPKPYLSRLQSLAQQLGLEHQVTFVGPVPPDPDLRALYDRATVFVLASLSEGTPMVITEAMSRGCPVIATAVGGIPGIIEDGVNGFLVQPGDAAALSDRLEKILNSPGPATAAAQRALAEMHGRTVERAAHLIASLLIKTASAPAR
jgi:glycosyltransferase involved in cell wall biosynthesis